MQPVIIISVCWLALIAVWTVAAVMQKQGLGDRSWSAQSWMLRLVLAASVLLVVKLGGQSFPHNLDNMTAGWVGATLAVAGTALAIWARATLGGSWAWPMTKKPQTTLVTTGPYMWIRHPIYSALMLLYVGTSIGINYWLLLPFGLMTGYFVYAALQEEQEMRRKFGQDYEKYTRRSKMLVPFVV